MPTKRKTEWQGILASPLFPPRHTLTGGLLGKREIDEADRGRWIVEISLRIRALFQHFGISQSSLNWKPDASDYAVLVMRLAEQLRIPGFLPPPAKKENIRDTPEAMNARADLLSLVETDKAKVGASGPKKGDAVVLRSILKKVPTSLPAYYRGGKKKAGIASLRADLSRARKERKQRERFAELLRGQSSSPTFNLGLGGGTFWRGVDLFGTDDKKG